MKIDWQSRDVAAAFGSAIWADIVRVEGLEKGREEVRIVTDKGTLKFHHIQDCCESVHLGDFDQTGELVGSRINSIEVVENADGPEPEYPDSYTWTFYKIETNKGSLWLRFIGESNGYYSESVDVDWSPA